MNMKHSISLLLAFLLVLSSCNRIDMLETGGKEIVLHSSVEAVTKAGVVTTGSLGEFFLTAIRECSNGDTLTYIDNQPVKVAPDGTCYDYGKYYYPDDGFLHFHAYGPSEFIGEGKQVEVLEQGIFDICPATDPSQQVDFVYAYARQNGGLLVDLKFSHAESQIRLAVRNSNRHLKFRIHDWGVKYIVPSGQVTCSTPGGDFSWQLDYSQAVDSLTGVPNGYKCICDSAPAGDYYSQTVLSDNEGKALNMIVIPQDEKPAGVYDAVSGYMDGAYVFLTMDILNRTEDELPIVESTVCCWPVQLFLESGTSYTYCVDLAEGGYYETDRDKDGLLDEILAGSEVHYAALLEEWDLPVIDSIRFHPREGKDYICPDTQVIPLSVDGYEPYLTCITSESTGDYNTGLWGFTTAAESYTLLHATADFDIFPPTALVNIDAMGMTGSLHLCDWNGEESDFEIPAWIQSVADGVVTVEFDFSPIEAELLDSLFLSPHSPFEEIVEASMTLSLHDVVSDREFLSEPVEARTDAFHVVHILQRVSPEYVPIEVCDGVNRYVVGPETAVSYHSPDFTMSQDEFFDYWTYYRVSFVMKEGTPLTIKADAERFEAVRLDGYDFCSVTTLGGRSYCVDNGVEYVKDNYDYKYTGVDSLEISTTVDDEMIFVLYYED